MAWASAAVGQIDVPLLAVLARAAERHVGELDPQSLANTA